MQIHSPQKPQPDRQLLRLQGLCQELRRHQRALGCAIQLLHHSDSPEALGARAAEALRESMGCVYGACWLRRPDGGLALSAESGLINEEFAALPRGEASGLVLQAAQRGAPQIAAQLGDVPGCPRAAVARRAAVRASLALPLRGEHGVVAVLEFFAMEPLPVSPDQEEALRLLCLLLSAEVRRLH